MSAESVRERLDERSIEWFQEHTLRGQSPCNDQHAQRYELLVLLQQADYDLSAALAVVKAANNYRDKRGLSRSAADAYYVDLVAALDAFEVTP